MTPDLHGATGVPPASPQDAFDSLLAGNDRFVTGAPGHPNQDAGRRTELATQGQRPFAVLFGCSDSRLAAEIIFDRGLGDLFVVRTAGHVLGPEVLGSIEYGIAALGAPLVVVLGHDSCGAVGAALASHEQGTVPGGYLREIVERLSPEIHLARSQGITDPDDIARQHVATTVDMLLQRSRVLADATASGQAAVVGLSYALADGRARLVTSRGLAGEAPAEPTETPTGAPGRA